MIGLGLGFRKVVFLFDETPIMEKDGSPNRLISFHLFRQSVKDSKDSYNHCLMDGKRISKKKLGSNIKMVLSMEEILHHLGCKNTVINGMNLA